MKGLVIRVPLGASVLPAGNPGWRDSWCSETYTQSSMTPKHHQHGGEDSISFSAVRDPLEALKAGCSGWGARLPEPCTVQLRTSLTQHPSAQPLPLSQLPAIKDSRSTRKSHLLVPEGNLKHLRI